MSCYSDHDCCCGTQQERGKRGKRGATGPTGPSGGGTGGKIDLQTQCYNTLPVINGGTNIPGGFTIGDLLCASASSTLSKLSSIATGNVFHSGGVGGMPYYAKVSLTTDVSGILPPENGGYQSIKNVLYVTKNTILSPGQFNSIADAIASISIAPSDTNRYTIYIYDGDYEESQLIIPSYVFLVGQDMNSVRISSVGGQTDSFMKFQPNSGMSFLTVMNTNMNYPAVELKNYSSDETFFHKLFFINCPRGILCSLDSSATTNGNCRLEYLTFVSANIYALSCNTSGTAFKQNVSLENFTSSEHSNNLILVDGANTNLILETGIMIGDGAGNCIVVSNGANLEGKSLTINNFFIGLQTVNDSGFPNVQLTGILFVPSTMANSLNIDIQNLNTFGNFTGWSQADKTNIPDVCPFFIVQQQIRTVTVAAKGADYDSIVKALASFNDESATTPYVIQVEPGLYVEKQIILRPYIRIIGANNSNCVVKADVSLVGSNFIIGAGYAGVENLTIAADYSNTPDYLIYFDGDVSARPFFLDNLVLDTSGAMVHQVADTKFSVLVSRDCLILPTTPFTTAFFVESIGDPQFLTMYLLQNFFWNAAPPGMANFSHFVNCRATQVGAPFYCSIGALTNCTIGQNFLLPAPTPVTPNNLGWVGVEVFGRCCFFLTALNCNGMSIGTYIPNSSEITHMIVGGALYNFGTMDLIVESPKAFGVFEASAFRSKISIVPSDPTNPYVQIGMLVCDPGDPDDLLRGGVLQTGDLYQGVYWNDLTNISQQIQHASSTGVIGSQPTLTAGVGLLLDVGAGSGYLMVLDVSHPTDQFNHMQYVTWDAVIGLNLLDNSLNWIYVNSSGIVSIVSGTEPDPITNIVLGAVKTYSGSITYIQEVAHILENLSSNIDVILRNVFGPIVASGCLASPGSDTLQRAVQVSSGSYSLSVDIYNPTANDNISMIGFYGTTQTASFTSIPLDYDNAGTLTAIPSGQFAKHSLYMLTGLSGASQYFFVYGQQLFASQLAATDGPIPLPPTTFTANMCLIAGIVVTDTTPTPLDASSFVDQRPTLQFRSTGSTVSADHNSLLNLAVGDVHTQYLPVAGTRPMSGTLNMANNNIINSGTINNVTITAHETRHLPGGPDALATDIPVNIGTSNQLGAAAAFSRSDHVHAGVYSLNGTSNQINTNANLGAITLSTPSVFNAPGTIQDTTGMLYSTTSGITANGADQGTATVLTTSYNEITSVAVNTGVILPAANKGLRVVIVNQGANTLKVYPDVGSNIDLAATNIPVVIPSNGTSTYEAISNSKWYTVDPVIVAGSAISVSYDNGQTTINGTGGTVTSINTGAGLTGGPITSSGTISMANTTVTPNTYGSASAVPSFTVNAQGQLTNASSSQLNLATGVSGILGATNGGLGTGTFAVGDLFYANTTTSIARLPLGTAGQKIIAVPGSAPLWISPKTTFVSGVASVNASNANNFMLGLNMTYTVSSYSTKLSISIGGTVTTTNVGGNTTSTQFTMAYGTGTAPAHGLPSTGTTFGTIGNYTVIGNSITLSVPYNTNGAVTVSPNQTYWFDYQIQLSGSTTPSFTFVNNGMQVIEL